MKRNSKLTKYSALICVISFVSSNLEINRVAAYYRHLAPPSALRQFDPDSDEGPERNPTPSRHSSRKGLLARLSPALVAFALGAPPVVVLMTATPAFADDPESVKRSNEMIEEIKNIFKLADQANRSLTENEISNVMNKLAEIKQISNRTRGSAQSIAPVNPLLGLLNHAPVDFQLHPEIIEKILEVILDMIKNNQEQDYLIRIPYRNRGIYTHPQSVPARQIPEVLMREFARRIAAESTARIQREGRVSQADEAETRLTPQIFKLYAMAAHEGLFPFDDRLFNEVVNNLSPHERGRMRHPSNEMSVRIFIGAYEALARIPVTTERIRVIMQPPDAQGRNAGWLVALTMVGDRRGFWNDRPRFERLVASVKQHLRHESFASLPLPTETSVDRNQGSSEEEERLKKEEEEERKKREEEKKRREGEARSWRQSLGPFFLILVPLVIVVAAGYFIYNANSKRRLRARIGDLKKPDLSKLFPPSDPPFVAPKLIDMLREALKASNGNAKPRPFTSISTLRQFGSFKVGAQSNTPQGVLVNVVDPLRSINVNLVQVGNFLIDPQPRVVAASGNLHTGLDILNSGSPITVQQVGNFWVSLQSKTQWNGLSLYRAWDATARREVMLFEAGSFIILPWSEQKDALGRNFIFRAFDKQTHTEISLLETSHFLIMTAPSNPQKAEYRAWDWEARAETTLTKFDQYYLIKRLGAGGMGRVDLALYPATANTVAIKQMLPDALKDREFVARFQREMELMGKIDYLHVVPVYKSGSQPTLFYVMPAIDGITFEGIPEEKQVSLADLIEIGIQMARGFQFVHKFENQEIVHRDLKPANLFLTRAGTVQISDFGAAHVKAKVEKDKLTVTGTVMGTPMYMSPEQIHGEKADKRTDIYAMGMILYELAAKRTPYEQLRGRGQNNALMIYKAADTTHDNYPALNSLRPDLPLGFEDIVRKAMAYSREAPYRYQSAVEMIRDLEALRQDPTLRFNVQVRLSQKKRVKIAVGAALAGSVALSASLAALLSGRPSRVDSGRDSSVSSVTTTTSSKKDFTVWNVLQALPRAEAIRILTEEITQRGAENEAGRSLYYRARLQLEEGRQQTDPNARRRIYEEALRDLNGAAVKLPELATDPRFLLIKAQIQAGLVEFDDLHFDAMEATLREAENAIRRSLSRDRFQAESDAIEEMRAKARALRQQSSNVPPREPNSPLPFDIAA